MDNKSERNEISLHEVKVFSALKQRPNEWLTNKGISDVSGVKERTVRLHTLRLVKLGMLEQAEVFPAHRFKWSTNASKRNMAYSQRIEKAVEIFGMAG